MTPLTLTGLRKQHEAGEEDTPGDMYDYLVASYRANAKPAARGHRVFARNGKKAWGLGRGIFEPLRDAALKLGLVFHRHSEACQFAVDNEGRVIGVRVLSIPGDSSSSQAFERNIARAERFFAMLPPSFPAAAATIALGNHYLRKARAIERTQRQSRWIRVHGGVVLSAGGFIMNPAMVKQALDPMIVPFQRDITLVNLLFNSRKARSLDTLANDVGLNPDTLTQTVYQYNQAALGLAPDAFGKNKSDMRPLNRGPLCAMDISVSSRFLPLAAMTVDGLRIEEESGHALVVHGQPIAGLYAAGRTAIGIPSQTT